MCDSFSYNGFAFFRYFRNISLARLTEDPVMISGSPTRVIVVVVVVVFVFVFEFVMGVGLVSLRKTDENLESEKYLLFDFLCWFIGNSLVCKLRSSSVTELGREESQHPSVENEECESDEWRAVVVADEEVEEEERSRVRTMEIRGERWRGRSWPL